MGAVDKALASIESSLGPKERILGHVSATRVEKGNSGTERGALVSTSERVLYRGFALFGVGTSLEWRLSQLNGIAATKSMMLEHIEVNAGGSVVKFLVQYGEAQGFVSKANEALAQNSKSEPSSDFRGGLAGELSKLAELYSQGLLTDAEFANAKKKLTS